MKSPDQILDRFHDLLPWTRFDESHGVWIEPEPGRSVCAFFRQEDEASFSLLILRGEDPVSSFVRYQNHDWTPDFDLDFATTDGIVLRVIEDQVDSYESLKPGQAPDALRLDEKQLLFETIDAINTLTELVDQEKIPLWGEENSLDEICYHLWKVAGTWRAEVRKFPSERFFDHSMIETPEARIKAILKLKLQHQGVWEAASFYLPALRPQGDQDVFIQCAGIAERGGKTLSMLTIEAHADADEQLIEALLQAIELNQRLPEFVLVREESVYERIYPLAVHLGFRLRLRRKLRELTRVRHTLIEDFPDDTLDDEDEE